MPIVLLATHLHNYASQCNRVVTLSQGEMISQSHPMLMSMPLEEYNPMLISDISSPRKASSPSKKRATRLYKREDNNIEMNSAVVYKRYFGSWTPCVILILLVFLNVETELCYNMFNRLLALFDDYKRDNCIHFYLSMELQEIPELFYYCVIILCCVWTGHFLKYLLNIYGSLGANNKIHNQMVKQLNRAPVSFFDTNPSGRIINRFSNDL
jgi:ATP-binding cassette subfamily C (CFTR/MRP) protein 4